VSYVHKSTPKPNSLLLFVFDVLAFAGGAALILSVFHWLAGVLPIIDRLGLF